MKILKLLMLLVLSAPMLQGAAIDNLNTNLSSTTMKVYDKAGNRLVLYTNIPGADADTVRTNRSEFYTIHIRSAQTDYEWVEVYANATRCYGRDVNLSKMTWPGFTVGGTSLFADLDGHYDMRGWTHTYANIEMTPDSPIEVRITKKDAGWQINGTNVFQTANAYPAHRAHKPIVEGGQVFVTIDKPAQITIDINGQFDGFDTGKSYHDNVNSNRKYLHALTIFANPTLESKGLTRHLPKPGGLSGGVYYINPGATYPTVSQQSGASNIVFNPGVHNVGLAKIVLKDKKYYIPGDALVYGTLTTRGGSTANDAGYNITIYGYGTLSGAKLPHPKTIGKEGNEPAEDEHKGIRRTWPGKSPIQIGRAHV